MLKSDWYFGQFRHCATSQVWSTQLRTESQSLVLREETECSFEQKTQFSSISLVFAKLTQLQFVASIFATNQTKTGKYATISYTALNKQLLSKSDLKQRIFTGKSCQGQGKEDKKHMLKVHFLLFWFKYTCTVIDFQKNSSGKLQLLLKVICSCPRTAYSSFSPHFCSLRFEFSGRISSKGATAVYVNFSVW